MKTALKRQSSSNYLRHLLKHDNHVMLDIREVSRALNLTGILYRKSATGLG